MSGNPYSQDGLAEGFSRGFELALAHHREQEDAEYKKAQIGLENQKLGLEQQRVNQSGQWTNQQIAESQSRVSRENFLTDKDKQLLPYEIDEARMKPELTKSEINSRNAAARASDAQAGASRAEAGLRGVQTEAAKEDLGDRRMAEFLVSARDRVAGLPIDDPDYNQNAQLLDAFVHGKGPPIDPQKLYPTINTLFKPELMSGAQPGEGRRIAEVHINPETHDLAIVLDRFKYGPDGQPIEDSTTREHVQKIIPFNKVSNYIKGAGLLSNIATKLQAQGAGPEDIRGMIDSQLEGLSAKHPRDIKTNRNGVYNPYTGDFTNTSPNPLVGQYTREMRAIDTLNLPANMVDERRQDVIRRYQHTGIIDDKGNILGNPQQGSTRSNPSSIDVLNNSQETTSQNPFDAFDKK